MVQIPKTNRRRRRTRMAIEGRYLLLGLCLLLTVGCDDDKTEKAKKAATASHAQDEAEQQLIADPERAIPELKRRLRQSVKFQDGLVVVDSPFGMGTLLGSVDSLNQFFLRSSTPWALSCGMGMTVTFGNLISGDASRVSNDVRVTLTLAMMIDKSRCTTLGSAVGKEILTILAGR
jgi:hypothetical protein